MEQALKQMLSPNVSRIHFMVMDKELSASICDFSDSAKKDGKQSFLIRPIELKDKTMVNLVTLPSHEKE